MPDGHDEEDAVKLPLLDLLEPALAWSSCSCMKQLPSARHGFLRSPPTPSSFLARAICGHCNCWHRRPNWATTHMHIYVKDALQQCWAMSLESHSVCPRGSQRGQPVRETLAFCHRLGRISDCLIDNNESAAGVGLEAL